MCDHGSGKRSESLKSALGCPPLQDSKHKSDLWEPNRNAQQKPPLQHKQKWSPDEAHPFLLKRSADLGVTACDNEGLLKRGRLDPRSTAEGNVTHQA
ncbi:hypothetical protein NDU88_007479 [Pleurodeles waltl]|uniref:Prolactin receptor n=1 Tax=Pleurodeles waltl TaxID=8319 RepID=A0AAV7MH71_PLEWA|nr:hypothetical protein NDU88_007479 [Pleurodeles waltl]